MLRDRILLVPLKRLRLLWTEISRDREISCTKSEMSCESHGGENVSLADGNNWRPFWPAGLVSCPLRQKCRCGSWKVCRTFIAIEQFSLVGLICLQTQLWQYLNLSLIQLCTKNDHCCSSSRKPSSGPAYVCPVQWRCGPCCLPCTIWFGSEQRRCGGESQYTAF